MCQAQPGATVLPKDTSPAELWLSPARNSACPAAAGTWQGWHTTAAVLGQGYGPELGESPVERVSVHCPCQSCRTFPRDGNGHGRDHLMRGMGRQVCADKRAVRDDVSLYRGDKWLEQCGIPGILSSAGWNMVLITARLWDHSLCGPDTEEPGSTIPAGPFPPRTRPESVEFLSAQLELPFLCWTIGKALKGQRSPCSETRACAAGTHLNHARCSALPKAAAAPAATSHDSPSRPSAREPRALLSRPLLSPHSPTGFMAAAARVARGGSAPRTVRPPRPQRPLAAEDRQRPARPGRRKGKEAPPAAAAVKFYLHRNWY